jgi:hypothetical protein
MRVHIHSAFRRQIVTIYPAGIQLRLSQLVLSAHENDMSQLTMRAYAASGFLICKYLLDMWGLDLDSENKHNT